MVLGWRIGFNYVLTIDKATKKIDSNVEVGTPNYDPLKNSKISTEYVAGNHDIFMTLQFKRATALQANSRTNVVHFTRKCLQNANTIVRQ